MAKQPPRVREPVQAYLDEPDAILLQELSARTDLSKAELIRRGIRRLAQDMALAGKPFAGLSALSGVLDSAAGVPRDLAARHDDYLYGDREKAGQKRRR
ncbi:MAG TPA: ribbon-helix-helix protein, CopG family [Gemmatimonadaceae bacterium]